ncbi:MULTISPECIES: GNAT family N-acetyltransferase [unclassified Lentimicrobium]|uniref:GNAT family N-acetyltransferase n=1 Tax=unclassified Lentimicrobium TaxID=2677434 RepID=UPI001C132475|nr:MULTISPECIES: GNAT family N-acetyltransferase [unclassified Lentimicrobium]
MHKRIEIHSSRLLLREIESSDTSAIFMYRSDAQTNQYQGWIPEKLEEVNDFIEHKIAKEFNRLGTWFQLAIVLKESNKLIGDLGMHFLENDAVELGATIAQDYHGKGYATEALKGVINYLFNKVDKQKIKASVDPRNLASIAMIEKLGFKKEAHYRKSFFLREEWVDDVIYGLTKQLHFEQK